MTEHPTSVRLDDDTIERVDRIAEELSKRSAGLSVGRSRALKLIVDKGLASLESELGLAKRSKPKRK